MDQFQYAPAAAQIGNASTTDAGLMSASDKTKLDGVATGATANIGTVTGITMNSTAQTVDANGVVNLGTVVTDVSGKLDAPSTPGTSGQVLTSNGQGGQTWQTPSGGTVTDVQEDGTSILSSGVANILTMTGAGSSSAGTKGLVPAPAAGDQDKVLTGSGTWEVSPGAKAVVITGTITNTSGSYTTTINNDLVAAGMEMIGYELGNPSAFGAEIYVTPANGSVTISCSDVEGTSTIKIILLKVISDPTAVSSTEYTILNNRIGDLSTLTTTAKTSAVAAINEVDDHIANVLSDYHTASGSNSYASWSCKWVKIGRICSFVFAFTPSTAISSSIGGIEVTGMPNPVTVDYLCVFPAALVERSWVAANASGRYGGIKNVSATNPEVRACGSFEANKGYSFAGTYVTV